MNNDACVKVLFEQYDLVFLLFDCLGIQCLFDTPVFLVCSRWHLLLQPNNKSLSKASYFKYKAKSSELTLRYTNLISHHFHRQCSHLAPFLPNIEKLKIVFTPAGGNLLYCFNPFPLSELTHYWHRALVQPLPWSRTHTLCLEEIVLDMGVLAHLPQIKHLSLQLGSVYVPSYVGYGEYVVEHLESFSLRKRVGDNCPNHNSGDPYLARFAGANIVIPAKVAFQSTVSTFIGHVSRVVFSEKLTLLRLDDYEVKLQRM